MDCYYALFVYRTDHDHPEDGHLPTHEGTFNTLTELRQDYRIIVQRDNDIVGYTVVCLPAESIVEL